MGRKPLPLRLNLFGYKAPLQKKVDFNPNINEFHEKNATKSRLRLLVATVYSDYNVFGNRFV